MITKLSQSIFAKVKILAPGPKNGQIFRVFFHDCQTSFQKSSIISGTIIARANQKTIFEGELNSPSLGFRQIWPKVNGLASRGHQSQKSCFWANFFIANNFFIFICMYSNNIGTRVVLDSWVVSQIWLDSDSNESSQSRVGSENQGYESSQSRVTLIVIWVRVEWTGYCLSQRWVNDFSRRKRQDIAVICNFTEKEPTYSYIRPHPPPPGQQRFPKLGKMWWVVSQIWLNSDSNELSQSWVRLVILGFELSRSWVTWIVIWVRVESARKKWVEHNPDRYHPVCIIETNRTIYTGTSKSKVNFIFLTSGEGKKVT